MSNTSMPITKEMRAEYGKLGGRPKANATLIAQKHRDLLARMMDEHIVPITNAMIAKAESGDVPAYIALTDRYQGKPAQQVDLTSSTGQVVVFMPPELLAKHTIEEAQPVEVISNKKA